MYTLLFLFKLMFSFIMLDRLISREIYCKNITSEFNIIIFNYFYSWPQTTSFLLISTKPSKELYKLQMLTHSLLKVSTKSANPLKAKTKRLEPSTLSSPKTALKLTMLKLSRVLPLRIK
jgi:hypothetical protein